MTEPACLRVSSLAERWSCSPGKIRKMIHDGELPALRLGKMLRIPTSAVLEIEAGCHTPKRLDPAASPADQPGTSMTGASASLRAARIAAKLRRAHD